MANKIESDLCLWSLPEEAKGKFSPQQREFLEEVGRNGGFGFTQGGRLVTSEDRTQTWISCRGIIFLNKGIGVGHLNQESPSTVYLAIKINKATVALTPFNEVFSYYQALSEKPPHIVLFARDHRGPPNNALIYKRDSAEGSGSEFGNSCWSDAHFLPAIVFPTYMEARSPEAKRLGEIVEG